MRSRIKKVMAVSLAALISALLSGCGSSFPEELEGHWVDVNGNTTLEIADGKVNVSLGNYTEEFEIKLVKDGGTTYLQSGTRGGDFGLMSRLKVSQDYSVLTGYDMIMDEAGHSYRFVHNDDLESEREIVDLSTDMPKTIESREITTLTLDFRNTEIANFDMDLEEANYYWEIATDADGVHTSRLSAMGSSYVVMNEFCEVDQEYMEGLAELIVEKGIAEWNGYHKKNNVKRAGYLLYVNYASGEKLVIQAEGDAAADCPFDLKSLVEYAFKPFKEAQETESQT